MPKAASERPPSSSLFSPASTTKTRQNENETELILLGMEDFDPCARYNDVDECNNDSDTDSSVSSVFSGYFEPSDFLPWDELYSKAEYTHLGFAVVAGGFACLHPIVFVAGVITAFGALRAATHTYEYAACHSNNDEQAVQQQHEQQQKQLTRTNTQSSNESSPSTLNRTLLSSCLYLPNIIGFNHNDKVDDQVTFARRQGGDDIVTHRDDGDSLPKLTKANSSSSTGSSINSNNKKKAKFDAGSSSVPNIISSPLKEKIKQESVDPLKWVKLKHPSLPAVALDRIEFQGLNANEFFDVFFADDAPFGFPTFHRLRRDKEVKYGNWNNVTNSRANNDGIPSSVAVKERNVQYHAKTNSFLGPPYASTIKYLRAFFVSKKFLVIEIKTTLKDIPFCNKFFLLERWIVDGTGTGFPSFRDGSSSSIKSRKSNKKEQDKDRNGNLAKTSIYLTVTSKVYFTGDCPFESAILKESAKQISEISKCWNAMAKESLKITEATRTKRLRQQHQQKQKQVEFLQKEKQMKVITPLLLSRSSSASNNNFDADESVEIEHVDDNDKNQNNSGCCNSIKRKGLISQKLKQPQQRRLLRNRSISQFSKLLVRSTSMNSSENKQAVSPPKVRISSS